MDIGPIGLRLAPRTLLAAVAGIQHCLQHTNGQRRPAAATRSNVSATVLSATLSDRAISRSLAPPSCFRRRISRTRRIDTLSAGIGPPARHDGDEQSADYHPAVERLPPSKGGRLQIGMAEIKSESVADFIPES